MEKHFAKKLAVQKTSTAAFGTDIGNIPGAMDLITSLLKNRLYFEMVTNIDESLPFNRLFKKDDREFKTEVKDGKLFFNDVDVIKPEPKATLLEIIETIGVTYYEDLADQLVAEQINRGKESRLRIEQQQEAMEKAYKELGEKLGLTKDCDDCEKLQEMFECAEHNYDKLNEIQEYVSNVQSALEDIEYAADDSKDPDRL